MNIYEETVTEGIGVKATNRADINRGATGREISSDQADLFDEIMAWLRSSGPNWEKHSLTGQFRNELATRKLPRASCSFQQAFRMRWVEGTPTRVRMGAPEADITPAGRYNEVGCPALYLSLEYHGALREMENAQASSWEALWVQKYSIPLNQLSVVDIRANGVDDWIGMVFDCCETTERIVDPKDPYPCSRRIASLVKQAGYDCMLIPGVRGDQNTRYTNAVVFELGTHRGWDWQVGDPERAQR